jgi:holin-like protein
VLGFFILIAFELIGLELHRLGVPLPGPVAGLALFTFSLFAGWIKLEWVEKPSALLLRNMLLFFVPIIMGLVRLSPTLRQYWFPIAGSLFISLIAVMLTTGTVSHYLLHRRKESGGLE